MHFCFGYGALTLCRRPFQVVRLQLCNRVSKVLQPPQINLRVWAIACSLATTGAISFDFFSPVTEMFQFTEYTFPRERDHKLLCLWGFPIRKSSAGSACLAADRSLSQLATSFIGVQSRGIRVMR